MESAEFPDLNGQKLNDQRFHMLEDIAKELSGDVVFPTCFDVAMHIRKALQDTEQPLEKIIAKISLEPLIGAKLMQLANSVAFNPKAIEVHDLKGAISRLGMEVVRGTAMAITMSQMLRSRDSSNFADISQLLWRHSLLAASAAWVIAKRMTRLNPDEAMLAGMVHDLGAFYMLYRATQYEELRSRPQTLKYLIAQWHESIGVSLLGALEMPEDIVEAVRDHDVLRPAPSTPKNLRDVVYLANMLAGGLFEWIHLDIDQETTRQFDPGEAYLALKPEIQEHALQMRAVFG